MFLIWLVKKRTVHPERFRWGSEVKTNRWQNRLLWVVLDFLSLLLQLFIFFSAVFCSSAGINSSKHSELFRQTGTPHFTNHLWHQTHDPWSVCVCVCVREREREREVERKWSPGLVLVLVKRANTYMQAHTNMHAHLCWLWCSCFLATVMKGRNSLTALRWDKV